MLCGVPGSGKSWTANQLPEYTYVSHDAHKTGYADRVVEAAQSSAKPVLADCPFAERELRDRLQAKGITVEPKFIVEHPLVVKQRYEAREGRPVSSATLTRARTIESRADEWKAYKGTSEQVREHLKSLAKNVK
jgi:predicted kinase